jgi:hypothetical protein
MIGIKSQVTCDDRGSILGILTHLMDSEAENWKTKSLSKPIFS